MDLVCLNCKTILQPFFKNNIDILCVYTLSHITRATVEHKQYELSFNENLPNRILPYQQQIP